MPVVQERVDRLEKVLADFITNVGMDSHKLYNAQMLTDLQIKDMNRKWGELANKMGTMVEDLVHPSLERIIKEEFNLEVESLSIRSRRKLKDGRRKEYDALAQAQGYVWVNSTKSTLKSEDIKELIKDIEVLRDFFPEYKDKKIIGILASLYVDEHVIKQAEKAGFLVLSIGEQLMEVKNSKGFKPKAY